MNVLDEPHYPIDREVRITVNHSRGPFEVLGRFDRDGDLCEILYPRRFNDLGLDGADRAGVRQALRDAFATGKVVLP